MVDLHELDATDVAHVVKTGQASAVEVTQAALDRIADDQMGAFVHVSTDLALQQASRADELRHELQAADTPVEGYPPLLGVPLPIKDLHAVAGVPMQAGSAALAGYVPAESEGTVLLLEQAGSIMVGKTNTPEIGLPSYTETAIAPPARTPWDRARSAGGSSGGAAAAVAAGLVPIAHASDGGGSIRIPAASTGLVGLKASRGRISNGPGGVDGPGLGTQGVVTRTVRDTALALEILTQPWPGDDRSYPRERFTSGLDVLLPPLRIGVTTVPFIVEGSPVHPQARQAVDRAVRILQDLGHVVEAAPAPFDPEQWQPFKKVWSVMAASAPLPDESVLQPLTRWMREVGRSVTGLEYAAAISNGQQLQRSAARAWSGFDVILSPTLAGPPSFLGEVRDDDEPARDFENQCAVTPWTSTWNILGSPAMTVPLHTARVPRSDGGLHFTADPAVASGPEGLDLSPLLPFGVMLGGRRGADHQLLRLAHQLLAANE